MFGIFHVFLVLHPEVGVKEEEGVAVIHAFAERRMGNRKYYRPARNLGNLFRRIFFVSRVGSFFPPGKNTES